MAVIRSPPFLNFVTDAPLGKLTVTPTTHGGGLKPLRSGRYRNKGPFRESTVFVVVFFPA